MANIIIYDEQSGKVLQYRKSVNTPEFEGKPGILINPDLSKIKNLKDSLVVNHKVENMTSKQIEDNRIKFEKDNYAELRAREYLKRKSIGDQLDAILKQFNVMRLAGTDMNSDLDEVLGDWLAVKAKYPKPEGE